MELWGPFLAISSQYFEIYLVILQFLYFNVKDAFVSFVFSIRRVVVRESSVVISWISEIPACLLTRQ